MKDDLDEELARLLPFYANGSLTAADVAHVEAALQRSAALRNELAAVQSVQAMVQRGGMAFGAADDIKTAARLEKLLVRIDAEAVPSAPKAAVKHASHPGFWNRLFSFHWQPALAMSAAALVLFQAGTIGYLATRDTLSGYGTLSGPDTTTAKAIILLQFKTGARWFDIQSLMVRENIHFVDGPSDGTIGVVPNKPKTDSEIAALIAHLQLSPIVSFVGAAE